MNDDYDSMIEYGKTMKNMFCFKLISERNLILQLMALRFGDDVSMDQRLVPKRQDAAE